MTHGTIQSIFTDPHRPNGGVLDHVSRREPHLAPSAYSALLSRTLLSSLTVHHLDDVSFFLTVTSQDAVAIGSENHGEALVSSSLREAIASGANITEPLLSPFLEMSLAIGPSTSIITVPVPAREEAGILEDVDLEDDNVSEADIVPELANQNDSENLTGSQPSKPSTAVRKKSGTRYANYCGYCPAA